MKRKKFVSILLILALAVSTLAGCAKTNKDGGSEPTTTGETADTSAKEVGSVTFPLAEPVTMSMFAIMTNEYDLADNATFKSLEETTNVKWEIQSSMGGDLAEKKGLLFASNKYPDVFYKAGLTTQELEKYGKQGILLPLNDLIDQYAPNLKKVIEKYNAKDYITSSDGNIYALPEIDSKSPAGAVLFFNQVWLKNLGLEEPKNLDELYKVLKAFKEKDANGNGDLNDEIPFIADTDGDPITYLLPYFGLPVNYATYCAVKDNELIYVPTSAEFKEFVAFVTKLYSEGLLDKNSFTQKKDQQIALGSSGDVLGSFFDAGAFLTVGRERDDDFRILTPFEEGTLPVESGVFGGTFAITDTCKNPEIAMAWIDQFYTEEGGQLAWLGMEGKTYKVNDDGTWEWILDGEYGADIATVRFSSTIQGSANHPSIQPSLWFTGMTDPDEKLLTEERDRVCDLGAEPFPLLRIADKDTASIATIKADTDVYINQYIAQVATGAVKLDASWDEYVATLKQMGADEMVQLYKDAYAAK